MGEKEEELKNWKVAIVRVYRSEFIKAKTEEEAREIANPRCGSNEGVGVIVEAEE